MKWGSAMALCVAATLLSGCVFRTGPNMTEPELPAATSPIIRTEEGKAIDAPAPRPTLASWQAESAKGLRGTPVSLSLSVEDWRILAPAWSSTPSAHLKTDPYAPAHLSFLFLERPVVEGRNATWLVVEGDDVLAFGAATTVVSPPEIWVGREGPRMNITPPFPVPRGNTTFDWADANASYSGAGELPLRLNEVALSNFKRATAYFADGTNRSYDRSVHVQHAGRVLGRASVESDSWSAFLDGARMLGNASSGAAIVPNGTQISRPIAVVGATGTVFVDHDRVSASNLRVTQLVARNGSLLPAHVEVWSDASQDIHVVQGSTQRSAGIYRESSMRADAVLANVSYEGPAAPLLSLPRGPYPDPITEIFRGLTVPADAGLPDALASALVLPFIAIPVAFAGFALAFGEMFACMFDGCPREPPPLPSWIPAGDAGEFTFDVDATAVGPGTYDGSIVLVGANFERVELPVHITVDPAPTPPSNS